MSAILFGPDGSPISSKFIKAAQNGNDRMPAEQIRARNPLNELITQRDFEIVSFLGDKIDANFGVSEGVISQRAMFAVTGGWSPLFYGEASEWGDYAIDWLVNRWFPYCDVAGPNFDWATGLYMDSVSIDARGDCITVLTYSEDGDGDWPMLQRIPNRQIGSWDYSKKVVGGKYDGMPIENGVIKNRAGRPIAYQQLGENRGEYKYFEAVNVVHTFEPRWYTQSRGFPLFMACLDEFRSMLQSQDWEMKTMLIASAIGIMETNAHGGPDLTDPSVALVGDASGNATGLTVENYWGGLIKYLKANSGQKIEQFLHQRPGQDWESFNDRLIRVCCAAANWPYALIWKKDGSGSAATRADQNIARKSISDRQSLLMYPAVRQVRFAISAAIKNGLIDPYPGKDIGGFLKWGFSMPPLMTIDEGRDRDQDREDFKIGMLTLEEKALRMGTTSKKLRDTRERETIDLITRSDRVSKQTGKDFTLVLNLMQQTNPNGAAAGGADAAQVEGDPEAGGGNDIESTKMEMDAYGVGVRAGALTPNDEDEAAFRAKLGLPAMNSNVNKAWTKDGGTRRPITIVTEGAPGQQPAQSQENEE